MHERTIPSARQRYLSFLRYHLRGEAREFVEESVALIDSMIREQVDGLLEERDVTPTLDAINQAEKDLVFYEGRVSPDGSIHRIRVAVARRAQFLRESRAFGIAGIEAEIVKRLMPAQRMAELFRAAANLKKLRDGNALWLDAVTIGCGMMMILAPGVGVDHVISRLAGVAPIALGLLSTVARRLPIGKATRFVAGVIPWIRNWVTLGAAGTGVASLTSVVIDLHMSLNSNGLAMSAHFEHLPVQLVGLLAAVMLGLHPKELARHATAIRRCHDLDVYRDDCYGHLRLKQLEHERRVGYFTEEI